MEKLNQAAESKIGVYINMEVVSPSAIDVPLQGCATRYFIPASRAPWILSIRLIGADHVDARLITLH